LWPIRSGPAWTRTRDHTDYESAALTN